MVGKEKIRLDARAIISPSALSWGHNYCSVICSYPLVFAGLYMLWCIIDPLISEHFDQYICLIFDASTAKP